MCGINWFAGAYGPDTMMAMNKAIEHRGTQPGVELYAGNKTWLGHVRLPIQNLDPRYKQPWPAEHNKYFAGNFELYDYGRTGCLSDVSLVKDILLNGDTFSQFDGFYSIVFDSGGLITDQLNKRPIYILGDTKGPLAISSEIKGLMPAAEFRGVKMTLDPQHLARILKFGYSIGKSTVYEQITRSVPRSVEPRPPMEIGFALEVSVKNRLVSSVPTGILLSGGLDSSLIFAMIAKIGFPEDFTVFHINTGQNEWLYAVELMAKFGYKGKVVQIDITDQLSQIEEDDKLLVTILRANESPMDLGSMVPQYLLCKEVSKHCRVVLTGDGADELFGGYRRAKEYDSQLSDVLDELPFYHFPRLDKLSMAHALELRYPYLSDTIVFSALQIPYDMRTEKQVLKKIAYELGVPDSIISRPKVPFRFPAYDRDPMTWRKKLMKLFIEHFSNGIAGA